MRPKPIKATEERFNRKLQRLVKSKMCSRKTMTKQEYSLLIKKVIAAKKETPSLRTEDQSNCLRRYGVVKVGRTRKLIAPAQQEGKTPRLFVHDKELFKILHRLHIRTKHSSIQRMHNTLKSKYKNITWNIVWAYVSSCAPCVRRAKARKLAQIEYEEARKNLTRGQIECLQMYPRGRPPVYKHLMMYHDHVNMYDVASPIESENPDKIAKVLSDIFNLFGTPDILQTTHDKGFVRKIVRKLRKECPGINIEPKEIKFKELWKTAGPDIMMSRNPNDLDIGDIFTSWISEVADRLRSKLSDVVEGRRWGRTAETCTPYDAMFVRNVKTSPRWSHLSGYTLDKIKAENLVQNRKPVVRLYNKSYF